MEKRTSRGGSVTVEDVSDDVMKLREELVMLVP